MLKKLLLFSTFLLICVFVATTALFIKVKEIDEVFLSNAQAIEFEVSSGANLYGIKSDLSPYVSFNDLIFRLWVKLNPQYSRIQAGLYEIQSEAQFIDVLIMMNQGKVKQFSVTLVEGLYFDQWLNALSLTDRLIFDIETEQNLYEQLVKDPDSFCANLYKKLEGCLLPDTYFFTDGTKASEIISRAFSSMQQQLDSLWASRFKDIPIQTKYEALIIASIIEKETSIESERSEIAGVFTNRLELNMRLQTDPTVIYGVKDNFDGNLTRALLRQATPYNTYVIKGLPITPIAMPNRASIQAALQPALTDSLYFVATGNGGHKFSTNLEDHNKAVKEYLKTLKSRKD